MSVQLVFGGGNETGVKTAPGGILRVEKARSSSGMHGERGPRGQACERRGPLPTRRGQSQYGTQGDVSSWHGPRLTTPFAAQVIAQAMGSDARNTSSAIAYRHAQIGRVHLLDDAV